MTIDEFIEKLRAETGGWYLDYNCDLRDTHCRCPIEAVARVAAGDYDDGIRILQLAPGDAANIIIAADGHDAENMLRARLLAAVDVLP